MPRVGHGQSSVFFANMDSSDDNQRNINQSEVDQFAKTTGKNLKGYLPRDQANEVKRLEEEEIQMKRAEAIKKDPTLAATLHGNTPNKGAMTDKELMEDDEATLKRMEEKKERKRAGLGSGERSMSG